MKVDRNSILYWLPKVHQVDVPMLKTVLVSTSDDWKELQLVGEGARRLNEFRAIEAACRTFGFPVFIRTDLMAAKHSWNSTCFVPTPDDLQEHLANLVEHTLNCDMIGRPVKGFAVREYIKMESSFAAFDGLPISRERRYFVKDGEVKCHHPYWPEDAIRFIVPEYPEPPDWRDSLSRMNHESFDEIDTLTVYAEKISAVLEGYWSVDFCRCKPTTERHGTWYFIDCALGAESWHPKCEYEENQLCASL